MQPILIIQSLKVLSFPLVGYTQRAFCIIEKLEIRCAIACLTRWGVQKVRARKKQAVHQKHESKKLFIGIEVESDSNPTFYHINLPPSMDTIIVFIVEL